MVELRLLRGVNMKNYNLPSETHEIIEKLTEKGMLYKDESHLKLTKQGALLYDTVASEII